MKIPTDGTRINVMTTAALFSMDAGHFRRLVRRGVLPKAKRTSKNMPYYDRTLLEQVRDVLRSGVGCNGEEIAFYRRRAKPQRALRRGNSEAAKKPDSFIESVLEGCRQLGVEMEMSSGIVLHQQHRSHGRQDQILITIIVQIEKQGAACCVEPIQSCFARPVVSRTV